MTDDNITTCFDCKHCRPLFSRYVKGSDHYRYSIVTSYVHCTTCKKPRPPFYAENCAGFESK